MPVAHEIMPVLRNAALDIPHRREDGPFRLIRRQPGQARCRRQLDVHAHAVRQHAQPRDERLIRAGDRLCMDIAREPVFLAQKAQHLDHALTRRVRRTRNP